MFINAKSLLNPNACQCTRVKCITNDAENACYFLSLKSRVHGPILLLLLGYIIMLWITVITNGR